MAYIQTQENHTVNDAKKISKIDVTSQYNVADCIRNEASHIF